MQVRLVMTYIVHSTPRTLN